MQSFEVIDPKGVFHNKETVPVGTVIDSPVVTAQISAWIRFEQVKEVPFVEKKSAEKPDKPEASDAAEKLAKEKGVDLALVKGTGAGGNITKGDVEAYLEASK